METRAVGKEEFIQRYREVMKERKRKRDREYYRYKKHQLYASRRGIRA